MAGTRYIEIPFAAADYLAAVRFHGRVLAEAAGSVAMDKPVPTCPGWTVLDLVRHIESVYRHKAESIRGDYRIESAPRTRLSDDADVASFSASLSEMLDVFEVADLSAPSWTWCPHEHRAEWWAHRMAHETLIHAADAVIASEGIPTAEPWLALDGIDEVLHETMIGEPSWGTVIPDIGRIDLSSKGRTWHLRFARFQGTSPTSGEIHDDEALIFDDDGAADALVATDPATLDLWLWGRGPLPETAQQGDVATIARLRSFAASKQ